MDIIYISHGNQFVIADFLVRHYQLDDVQIIVQCSPQNAVELQTLAAQRFTSLPYSALRFLFLPERPYRLVYRVLKDVNSSYEGFFKKTRPARVFMFSRERHYTLLVEQARAVGAKIIYVEEGASAYVLSQPLRRGDVFSGRRFVCGLLAAANENWRGTLLWELLSYPLRVYRTFKAFLNSQDVQLLRLKFSRFSPDVFQHSPMFDQALTVYSDLAQHSIRAKEHLPLPPDFRVQAPLAAARLPEKRFLMLMTNTRAFPAEKLPAFHRWLLYVLNDIALVNGATVEVKSHPSAEIGGLAEAIQTWGTDRIRLLDESNVSAETLLVNTGSAYKAVFAINSATFLYLNKLRPDLPLYTVGQSLNDLLRKDNPSEFLCVDNFLEQPEFTCFRHVIKPYALGSCI